jgi:alpha-N-arabinofuranosidase
VVDGASGLSRNRGRYPGTFGRETCLAPVEWRDGWPVVNQTGTNSETLNIKTLPQHTWPQIPARDDFDSEVLALHWLYLRNPVQENYSLTERKGFLRLRGGEANLFDLASPTFIARRQQHFHFTATAKLEFDPQGDNEEAG